MLEAVGVDPLQEQVFRSVIATPHRTSDDVAAANGLDPEQVAAAVDALEALGFLTRLEDSRPVPVRPDAAVEALIAQRRLELDQAAVMARALAREMRVQDQHRPENLVEVVVGQHDIADRFARLLGSTRCSLLVLDRPPYVSDGSATHDRIRRLLEEGVTVRSIYASDSLDQDDALPEALRVAEAGVGLRVHPQVPMKLAVFDESTALLPLSGDRLLSSALVVHGSSLVDALGEMFELLWRDALPLGGAPGGVPDDVDNQLDDAALSRPQGRRHRTSVHLSTRTVGRRVAELMTGLGARTRFQAGLFVMRGRLRPPRGD